MQNAEVSTPDISFIVFDMENQIEARYPVMCCAIFHMPKGKPRHLLLEAFFCAICLAFASWFAGDQNVLFTAVNRQLVHVCHKEVHERQESSRKPKKAQDSSSILGCLLAGLTQLRLLGFPVGDLSKDKAEISPVFDLHSL